MRRFSVFMRWLPALVILCVSWHLSSQQSINDMPVSSVYRLFMDLPSDEVIESHLPDFLRMDKIVHCVCFAAFSFWVAFAVGIRPCAKVRLALPVGLLALYAAIDEVHQSFTPHREISIGDWTADVLGAVIGSVIFFCIVQLVLSARGRSFLPSAPRSRSPS